MHNYICLFDLPPYDHRVAPALRLYQDKYDPSGVVALMQNITKILPELKKDPGRPVPDDDDCKHWIDSLGPDAGYKPSEQTMREVASLLIECLCLPRGLGFNPMQDLDKLVPSLSDKSEWFADLMDGGEELAGGRLAFTVGSGALIATRQQIRQFLEEVQAAGITGELVSLLSAAEKNPDYTLLKTSV